MERSFRCLYLGYLALSLRVISRLIGKITNTTIQAFLYAFGSDSRCLVTNEPSMARASHCISPLCQNKVILK
jgi:hypothetical protein